MFPTPHPHAQLQSLHAIQAMDAFPIDQPALTAEQDPNPHIAKPWLSMSQVSNAEAEGRLILGAALSIPRSSTKFGQATGPRTTHLKRPVQPLGELPATRASALFSPRL